MGVADTHTAVWHLFDDERLSLAAGGFIDQAASAVLAKKGRLPIKATVCPKFQIVLSHDRSRPAPLVECKCGADIPPIDGQAQLVRLLNADIDMAFTFLESAKFGRAELPRLFTYGHY